MSSKRRGDEYGRVRRKLRREVEDMLERGDSSLMIAAADWSFDYSERSIRKVLKGLPVELVGHNRRWYVLKVEEDQEGLSSSRYLSGASEG